MRRRNAKNAHERVQARSGLMVLNPTDYKGKWRQLFGNNNPIYLEIGMGKGKFIIEHAKRNPNINYIGIEKFEGVIIQACDKLKDQEPTNLHLIAADATNLLDMFEENEINKIFLNFSDPWPKNRHAKRRLTSSFFLNIYDSTFKGKPHIIQKTDNIGLFASSIVSLSEYGYTIHNCSLDLHNEDMENFETEYEHKFSSKGQKINYLDAVKE